MSISAKFLKRVALSLIFAALLFTTISTLKPKTSNAQFPDCAFDFPDSVAAGSTLNIDVGGTTVAGHEMQAGIIKDGAAIASARQTMPASLSLNLAVAIPAGTAPGPYLVQVVSITSGIVCVVRAPSADYELNITAGGSGEGAGSIDCSAAPPERTNKRGWFDYAHWVIPICNDTADQVVFSWSQVASMEDAVLTSLTGISNLHPETNTATSGTGALASTGNLVAFAYKNPPISGTEYLAGQFQKLNPVQPAYAQGVGYETLQPVQEAWEAMRNISYVGFVLVFVIIGFMIMFRAHISPQAVATVQDSLPRIVIALVLVTFSYAIAGLMIDIMFLALNVLIAALPASSNANIVFEQSIIGVMWDAWDDSFGVVFDTVNDMLEEALNVPGYLSWLGGSLTAIVVAVALLFVMFKVLVTLLIAYATIIILTLAAPFFFLLQALPGNNSGSTWFKQMAANIAVFPAVAGMIILAGYLAGIGEWGFGAPAINESAGNVAKFPLLAGDIEPQTLSKLVGVGILLMTPGVADLIKNTIGAKTPGGGAAGAAAAGALGAGAATTSAGFGAGGRKIGGAAGETASNRFGSSRIGQQYKGWATKIKGGPKTSGSDL